VDDELCNSTPTFQSGQGACSAKEVSRRLTAHKTLLTADGSQQEVRNDEDCEL